jgi:hypothetical protein
LSAGSLSEFWRCRTLQRRSRRGKSIGLDREMDMRFWLEQASEEVRELG